MSHWAEPVWLDLAPDPVLALLDRPPASAPVDAAAPPRVSTAVLFCPPFGWEEMCSYRGRSEWARRLAAAGFPCARLALPGTGDSGGTSHDPARLGAWVDAVSGAAAWLAQETGALRVAALGIGLGGMLACLAARAGAPVDDLILWGTRDSGRAMLRELRAHAGVIAAHYPEDLQPAASPDGDLELIGFVMAAETARDLEAVESIAPGPPPDGRRRVLLLGRDRLPVDRRLHHQFKGDGAEVTVLDGPDYTPLMSHPQESIAPEKTIQATIAWLSAADGGPGPVSSSLRQPGPRAIDRAPIRTGAGSSAVTETALRFSGEVAGSFAVVTEPAEGDCAPVCAVWLNGGALHHIGPNRAWVEAARRWAARGVTTVRVDLPGIGESATGVQRPIETASLYRADRQQAARAVLEQLVSRGVGDRFVLGGLCSGAYWSLHAALETPLVAGLMLLNLRAFFWTEELEAERATEKSLQALRGRGWRRLLRGQLSAEQIRAGVASLTPSRLLTGGGYPVQRAQTPHIEAALDQLRDQGTETLLLLAQGEPLYDQLSRAGLLDRVAEWPNLRLVHLPTRDHMFRAVWLQRRVHGVIDLALDHVLTATGEMPAKRGG